MIDMCFSVVLVYSITTLPLLFVLCTLHGHFWFRLMLFVLIPLKSIAPCSDYCTHSTYTCTHPIVVSRVLHHVLGTTDARSLAGSVVPLSTSTTVNSRKHKIQATLSIMLTLVRSPSVLRICRVCRSINKLREMRSTAAQLTHTPGAQA